jgi:hypothetical protein
MILTELRRAGTVDGQGVAVPGIVTGSAEKLSPQVVSVGGLFVQAPAEASTVACSWRVVSRASSARAKSAPMLLAGGLPPLALGCAEG